MAAKPFKLAFGMTFAVIVAAATVAKPTPADAQSRVCRQLEAELAAPSGGGGSSSQARRYDAAIERQRTQLGIARSQARDVGCGFSLLSRNRRQCGGLNATIDKMERNLDALQSKRAQFGGRKSRSSAKILASLEANGCRDDEQVAVRRPQEDVGKVRRNATLLDRVLRGGIDDAPPPPRNERRLKRSIEREDVEERAEEEYREPLIEAPLETFRTMCVRTCDGYMFPMSQAASVRDFERDQKNCESACPGTDLQVFYRPADSEDTAEMVSSVTGAPYSQMPTANLYKDASSPRVKSCGCNPVRGFEVVAGTPPVEHMGGSTEPAEVKSETAPIPVPRPDPGEAVASAPTNTEQSVPVEAEPVERPSSILAIPAPVAPAASAEVVPDTTTAASATSASDSTQAAPAEKSQGERKVRVVGPTFLPDPEAAADPQAPDQTSAQ